MNKEKAKGTIDDAAGRVKRQVGEWTGDTNTQVEGAAQQIKGKAEKAVGNIKDAAKNASHDADNYNRQDTADPGYVAPDNQRHGHEQHRNH